MVSLCGIISGLTITDDQHLYIYIWLAFTVYAAFWLVSWETTVGFGFHLPSLPWRYQSSLKPSTFSKGEDIEIYLVQFSAQKSLGAAAQTWRLERKKSCNIFFFASSLRLLFSFRGIWYIRFSEMGFVFGLPEFAAPFGLKNCRSKSLLYSFFNFWPWLAFFWGNVYFLFISVVMYLGETTPLYVGTIRAFSTLGLLDSHQQHGKLSTMTFLDNDRITKFYPHAAA